MNETTPPTLLQEIALAAFANYQEKSRIERDEAAREWRLKQITMAQTAFTKHFNILPAPEAVEVDGHEFDGGKYPLVQIDGLTFKVFGNLGIKLVRKCTVCGREKCEETYGLVQLGAALSEEPLCQPCKFNRDSGPQDDSDPFAEPVLNTENDDYGDAEPFAQE